MDEMTAILQENMELHAENQLLYQLVSTRYRKKVAAARVPKVSARNEEMKSLRWDKNWTLQEIADQYNISRERVRQVVGNSEYINMKSKRNKTATLANPNLTNTEIGDALGVSEATASKYRQGTRHAIKPNSSLFMGIEKENEYAKILTDMGMDVELMPHNHKFDALVNGWRVDFKYNKSGKTSPSLNNVNPAWRFGVRGKRENCDFYFCITAVNDVFIIPSEKVPASMTQLVFCYPVARNSQGKWQSYKDRYDLLQSK